MVTASLIRAKAKVNAVVDQERLATAVQAADAVSSLVSGRRRSGENLNDYHRIRERMLAVLLNTLTRTR
ncbi:hypothetical protein [Actinoplanes sp. NPDC026619]|uniref:hypothetical protein n=1 Tax=Actinoplanes sp. NPDC026619 TaxID=3155798 RepID=UPI0033F3A76B